MTQFQRTVANIVTPSDTRPSMKLLLLITVATCFLLVATLTVNVTAQHGIISVPFTECGSYGFLEITEIEGPTSLNSQGWPVFNASIYYESNEQVSGGTYNVTVTGRGGQCNSTYEDEYSGSLASVTALPISENQQGNISLPFTIYDGTNTFVVTLYDENLNELACFSFEDDSTSDNFKSEQNAVQKMTHHHSFCEDSDIETTSHHQKKQQKAKVPAAIRSSRPSASFVEVGLSKT